MAERKSVVRKSAAKAESGLPRRQATARVNLALNIPDGLNLALLDRWLVEVLELEIEPMREMETKASGVPQDAIAFCWRQLLLYRALMQAATMPVFDAGRICEASASPEDGNRYRFVVRIVPIINIVGAGYPNIFRHLANLSSLMVNHEIGAASRNRFFKRLRDSEHIFRGNLRRDATRLPILETALEMGIPFEHAGRGVYQMGWGKNGCMLDGSATEDDPRLGFMLSKEKVTTARLMRAAGIPTAENYIVSSMQEAKAAADKIGWPVVVKPADKEGGAGVTTQVSDPDALALALAQVSKTAERGETVAAMVERQHQGTCHRLYVYNDELLFGVKRSPPAVVGDGRQTVEQLVRNRNQEQLALPPRKQVPVIPVDAELERVLADAGYTLASIPGEGEWVNLRYIESMRWGGRGDNLTDKVHPENRLLARKCAALLCLKIAGIDMITEDVSVPWYENGAIINEINFKPFFGNFDLTRPYVRPFLNDLLKGCDGRIPVMAFVGGEEAMAAARKVQQDARRKGENFALTDEERTLLPDGTELYLAASGIAARGRALTYDRTIGGILLVVRNNDILQSDLVFDRIDRVVDCRSAEADCTIDDGVVAMLEALASE